MAKKGFVAFILLSCFNLFSQQLKISENRRYLEDSNGDPFLWIGDTAWELFHKLDREETDEYLTIRKSQGFSVIQAVLLAELDGLRTPNAYGYLPLIDLDPAKPNEPYFQHVDYVIKKANNLGLVVGVLPTWGDKLYSLNPGEGPIVFNKENAKEYGAYLGKRYRDKNIFWILGGDRNIDSPEVLEIWRAMAAGLRSGDDGKHLITFHPRGERSSSSMAHNEAWLDFNMYQSGHVRRFNPVYKFAMTDYSKKPTKPFVEGEPAYEDIPVRFWEYIDFAGTKKVPDSVVDDSGLIKDTMYFREGFFTDYDVRVHAYWNFLAGAAGFTYGNNAVWQMYKKGDPLIIPSLYDWRASLDRPGARQMIHLKRLLEIYQISVLVPDQSIISGDNPENEQHIRAAKSMDAEWALIYLAQGQKVNIVMDKMKSKRLTAYYYNPKSGTPVFIGNLKNNGIQEFYPPNQGLNNDWILVLDGKMDNYKKLSESKSE